MQRRDFVRGIAIASAAATGALGQQPATQQPATPPPTATQQGANPVQPAPTSTAARRGPEFRIPPLPQTVPDLVAVTDAHFFPAPQMDALRKLSSVLMPPSDGYPGAIEAGTPEFIDFLIGASPADQKRLYQGGLDHLNAEARRQFQTSFAQVTAAQADKLIRPALTTWMVDHPPADPFKHFVAIAHRDIRVATMNSQAWSVAAVAAGERAPGVGLYWSPVDPNV